MLIDRFGREVNYLRLSVTDRCDFRCIYCMADDMRFLPRPEVLTLEESLAIARAFVAEGVSKIRVTGGEPLVRQNVVWLLEQLAALPGLRTLALTTNGSRLAEQAMALRDAGVQHLNISIDSLRAERFRALTRHGNLADVLAGIDAACAVGFPRLRLNSVVLSGINDDEVFDLVDFAVGLGVDIAFIEEMPLGDVGRDRQMQFMPGNALRQRLTERFILHEAIGQRSGGPARYWHIAGTATQVGFIEPHSHNFCSSCNRVRLTAKGRLLLCLGNEHSVDLRATVRSGGGHDALRQQIRDAMASKPQSHHFDLADAVGVVRFMNETGG